MTGLREMLERLVEGGDLTESESGELLAALTDAAVEPAMSGALLAALRAKGITPPEVRGFAKAMRSLARRPILPDGAPAVDIVGTGGDASGSFNLSTAAALLVAAAGLRVIKHGNRSVSSRSGSADLLECLGLPLPLDERAAGRCLSETSFTFLFAPHYHPAMKQVAPVRRALGIRTVFNLLGPLTNPAQPPFGLIGAYSPAAARLMAETLSGMPVQRVFVVHGDPGWDEATPVGPFELFDVRPGNIEYTKRDPRDFGFDRCRPEDLAGGDAEQNARALRAVFEGRDRGPHRDAVVLNAALALEVAGSAETAEAAAHAAAAAIDEGAAADMLLRLAAFGKATGGAG